MSELSDLQAEFNYCQMRLAAFVWKLTGHKIRIRDGYAFRGRSCNTAVGGHKRSAHLNRLARDIILDCWNYKTKKWDYQRSTIAYAELGAYWETLHPVARWGGHWGDGNHFSFEYRGVK